jgi:hypothetical protein
MKSSNSAFQLALLLALFAAAYAVYPLYNYPKWTVEGPLLVLSALCTLGTFFAGNGGSGFFLILIVAGSAAVGHYASDVSLKLFGQDYSKRYEAAAPATTASIDDSKPATATSTTTATTAPGMSEAEAKQQALRLYPSLGQKDSPFNKQFIALHNKYKTERPDYFTNQDWPLRLANEVARMMNL